MDSTLKKLVDLYLKDINYRAVDNAASVQARGIRIKNTHDAIYREIVNSIDGTGGNIEGGSANTIYLITQVINGGNAANI